MQYAAFNLRFSRNTANAENAMLCISKTLCGFWDIHLHTTDCIINDRCLELVCCASVMQSCVLIMQSGLKSSLVVLQHCHQDGFHLTWVGGDAYLTEQLEGCAECMLLAAIAPAKQLSPWAWSLKLRTLLVCWHHECEATDMHCWHTLPCRLIGTLREDLSQRFDLMFLPGCKAGQITCSSAYDTSHLYVAQGCFEELGSASALCFFIQDRPGEDVSGLAKFERLSLRGKLIFGKRSYLICPGLLVSLHAWQ